MRACFLTLLLPLVCGSARTRAERIVKRSTAYPDSSIIYATCPNNQYVTSCARTDDSWPKGDLSCGDQEQLHHQVFLTVANGITRQTTASRKVQDPPKNMPKHCVGNEQGIYAYSHGSMTVFYALKTECDCSQGAQPQCTNAQQKTAEACNFSQITFCGATVNNQLCPAPVS